MWRAHHEKVFYAPGETIKGFVTLIPSTKFSYDRFTLCMKQCTGNYESTEYQRNKQINNGFILLEKYHDTFPETTPGIDCFKDNIALAGKKYMIPFSFVIPEQLSVPSTDNLLHKRLSPSFGESFEVPYMNINKYSTNQTCIYTIPRPKKSYYGVDNLDTSYCSYHTCRTSAADVLSQNFKPDTFRSA